MLRTFIMFHYAVMFTGHIGKNHIDYMFIKLELHNYDRAKDSCHKVNMAVGIAKVCAKQK